MSEWKERKLGDVVELIGGGTPKTTISEYWNGNIPWLSVVDFNRGQKYVYNTEKTITEKGLVYSSTKMLNKDDIIISARGTVGALAVLRKKMAFNQSCYGIRSIPDISHSDYLFYLIKDSIENFQQVAYGGVFDTITKETFYQIEILLPPLPEQRAIAGVLSSLDDKIDLLHRQNKTLEGMADAVWRKMFVEEADPGWKKGKLEDFCEIKNGFAFKSSDYRTEGRMIIRTLNFRNRFIDTSDVVFISTEEEPKYQKYLLKRRDFLLVMVGASLGNYSIVTKDILPALQNQNMWNFRAFEDISQHYLNHALRDTISDNIGNASGSAREFFQKGQFYKNDIIIPDKDILREFNMMAENSFCLIENNLMQICTLFRLRDTLLPKLMSGEVRVKL